MPPPPKKFTDTELTALHAEGKTDSEIALAFRVTRAAVRRRRKLLNLPCLYDPTADRPTRRKPKPKPASQIARSQPTADRQMRIQIIKDTWARVQERGLRL